MEKTHNPRYKRVLLKLSGESLMGESGFGIDSSTLKTIAQQIKHIVDSNIQIAVVVGGGNIFRGEEAAQRGMDRVTAD